MVFNLKMCKIGFCIFMLLQGIALAVPSSEELRWSVPPNYWNRIDEYFSAGRFYSVPTSMMNTIALEGGGKAWYLDVFGDLKSKEEKFRIASGEFIIKDKKIVCQKASQPSSKTTKNYFECQNGGCRYVKNGFDQSVASNVVMPTNFMGMDGKKCPFDLKVKEFQADEVNEESRLYFEYVDAIVSSTRLKVLSNNSELFVDISKCSRKPSACGKIIIEKSLYEKSLDQLKESQTNKSHPQLNHAIEKIKPCVLKKDIVCIKKYFLSNHEMGPDFIETKFTSEVLAELEECLDYKNLLPHQLATRGKKLACIFADGSNDKIMKGVAYIEAISEFPLIVNAEK